MGVSCLVSTGKSEVLDRFAFEIANIWLDVLGEIKEQENQKDDERCVLRIPDLLPLFVGIDPVDPPPTLQRSQFVLGQAIRGAVQGYRRNAGVRTPERGTFSLSPGFLSTP